MGQHLVVPKTGDKIALISTYGYYLATIDGINLTQVKDKRDECFFMVEYNGVDRICLKSASGKYLSGKPKDGFEFVDGCSDGEMFSPHYLSTKLILKTSVGDFMCAREDFKVIHDVISSEATSFIIEYAGNSLF